MSTQTGPILLYEGHYRALEKSLPEAVRRAVERTGRRVAVVTAGRPQLERVAGVLARESGGVLSGTRLFPGFRQFVTWAYDYPRMPEEPTHGDRIGFALDAICLLKPGEPFSNLSGNVSTAFALSEFFERLLERGIDAAAYVACATSLPEGPSPTEHTVGSLFTSYEDSRNRLYPCTPDSLLNRLVDSGTTPGELVIYGFYDLNPAQRRLLAGLVDSGWRIQLLTPVPGASGWARRIGVRTRAVLDRCGFETALRPDAEIPMGPFGQYAESLLGGRSLAVPAGLQVHVAFGAIGLARSVLSIIEKLVRVRGLRYSDIAVADCSRSSFAGIIVRLACHEGIPVNCPLEVPLLSMPACALLVSLLSIEEHGYHYTSLRSAALSGCLAPGFDPIPSGIDSAVAESGRRHLDDPEALSAQPGKKSDQPELAALVEAVRSFHESVPVRATPSAFLGLLAEGLGGLVSAEALPPEAISPEMFRTEKEMSFGEFLALYEIVLSVTRATLREADRAGFVLQHPETLRGTLHRAVIVTGLEEGVFPSATPEDPKLTAPLRAMLQLSAPEDRLAEESFLFRQVLEAADESVYLVHEEADISGTMKQPSMFLDQFTGGNVEISADCRLGRASEVLLGGHLPGQRAALEALAGVPPVERPFFLEAYEAERSRLSRSPFDEFDGVIGPEATDSLDSFSSSHLESYGRCPFQYLARFVWRLGERSELSMSSRPDSAMRGKALHRAIQKLIVDVGPREATLDCVRREIRDAAEELGLDKALGSLALMEVFIEAEAGPALGFLESLSGLDARFETGRYEKDLTGRFGSTPVHGRLDLLMDREDGSTIVVDLKTGKSLSRNKAAERTANGELFQLPIYHALAQQNGLDPSMAGYLFLSKEGVKLENQPLFESRAVEELTVASLGWAETFSSLIRQGYFPPLPRTKQTCESCAYSALCRRTPLDRIGWRSEGDARASSLLRSSDE